jgi:hypothetical protein
MLKRLISFLFIFIFAVVIFGDLFMDFGYAKTCEEALEECWERYGGTVWGFWYCNLGYVFCKIYIE